MKKTIKILSALGTTILGATTISFTVSATNSVNINKKNETEAFYNKMLELSKDKEKLNSLVEDFDEFEIVKSNLKIHKWIYELKFYTTGSLDEDILNLSKLKISEKQKIFMLSNLLDKYEFYIKNKTGGVKYSASPEIYKIIPYEASTKQGEEIEIGGKKFLTKDNVEKRLTNPKDLTYEYLRQKGNDIWTIKDYKTWDDETTIEWSNERLLIEWLRLINNKQENVVNQTKEILTAYSKSSSWSNTYNEEKLDAYSELISNPYYYERNIEDKLNLLEVFISNITKDFTSKAEAYTSLAISSITTAVSSSTLAWKGLKKANMSGYRKTFEKIVKDPKFIRYADSFNDFIDFSASSIFGAKGVLDIIEGENISEKTRNQIINEAILRINRSNEYLTNFRDKKLEEKKKANEVLGYLSTSTDIFSSVLSFASLFAPAAAAMPFISIGVGILSIIFSTLNIIFNVDSGNGYTIHENWHDHGLNDWRFQLKNNRENLVKIALDHSNGFKDNIQWTVTDGWFTFPELYIKNLTENKDTFLSPGTSFNFGNKIQFRGKSWKN